ncbi:hypothetical protein PF005_g17455 [Phytophthora fragariae]|nr:hypothetical protein PF005_g17455 [Phytophthora fragariae]
MPTSAPTTLTPTTLTPTPEPATVAPTPAPTTIAPSTEQVNTQEIKITSLASLDLSDDTPGQVNVGGWYSEYKEEVTVIPATVPTTPTLTTSSPAVVEAEPPHTMVVVDDVPEEYAVDEDADFTRVDDQTDDDIVVGSIRTHKACE